jgi:TRAP-type C4-dicarboxylate transport system permease small subunit
MLNAVATNLKRALFPVCRVVGAIGMGMIAVLMLITIIDVFMRRLFDLPLRGSHEVIELVFVIIVFLTLSYCAVKDGHIEVDMLVKRFPRTVEKTVSAIILFVTTGVMSLVTWQLVNYSMNLQTMKQTTVSLGISVYPFAYVAALGTLLITLVYFIQFLYSLTRFGGDK